MTNVTDRLYAPRREGRSGPEGSLVTGPATLMLTTLLAVRTLPATPPPVSPFATLDVLKLASTTPGVLTEQGQSCPQGPLLRLGAGTGCVALERLKSGQLIDGTWALIVPLTDPRGIVASALVYSWTAGAPQYAGILNAPGGLKASFKSGHIVQTTRDGIKIGFTIAQGRLQRV